MIVHIQTEKGFLDVKIRERKTRVWGGVDGGGMVYGSDFGPVVVDYVGVQDLLERDIYDGDIVMLTADSYSEKLGKCSGEWVTVVNYSASQCGYVLSTLKKDRNDSGLTWGFDELDFNGHLFKKRVIGNIFENADLLKPF